eukprot:m.326447 g.326447  ORF g.326447 m.326447 type:complete len:71 (-) comp20405_c0_seq2:11-223(-)
MISLELWAISACSNPRSKQCVGQQGQQETRDAATATCHGLELVWMKRAEASTHARLLSRRAYHGNLACNK